MITWTVEALVKAHGLYCRKAGLGVFDQGHGDLIVRGFYHDLMVQDEAVLIFDDRHPQAQLDRYAGLAFADPFGMGLKNGKDFFTVRNGFALQDPATNLVDLPLGVRQILVEVRQHRCRHPMVGMQPLPGGVRSLHMGFGEVEVSLISRFDLGLFGLPLGFVL